MRLLVCCRPRGNGWVNRAKKDSPSRDRQVAQRAVTFVSRPCLISFHQHNTLPDLGGDRCESRGHRKKTLRGDLAL